MNTRTALLLAIVFILSSTLSYAYDLTYDSSGNLVSDGSFYYEYDGFDNLVVIREGSQSGDVVEEYLYDDQGLRLMKTTYFDDGSNSTSYYVGNDFVQIVNNSGVYNVSYYYDGQVLLGKKVNDDLYFVETDHLGSAGVVTNESGAIFDRYEYNPFGVVSLGRAGDRLYTGKELDSSGLYYYGARYYNPTTTRFTQPDPVIADVYDPQNLNRYAYVLNNPYKYTDPDGRAACDFRNGCIEVIPGVFFGKLQWEEGDPRFDQDSIYFESDPNNEWIEGKNQWEYGLIIGSYAVIKNALQSLSAAGSQAIRVNQKSILTKLNTYALNPNHPDGKHKARVFESALGFNKRNQNQLANQLADGFDPTKATSIEVTEWGTKYSQSIEVTGSNGNIANVRTAWMEVDDEVKLITAYVE